jgi:hypothetical protein
LRHTRAEAEHHPQTRIVYVADSEADIYELLAEGMSEPRTAEWIVRTCQNRALLRENREETATPAYLREQLLAQPARFIQTINVRGRKAKVVC